MVLSRLSFVVLRLSSTGLELRALSVLSAAHRRFANELMCKKVEVPVVLATQKRKSTECKKYKKFKLPKVSTAKLRRQQTFQSRWVADCTDRAVKAKIVIEIL